VRRLVERSTRASGVGLLVEDPSTVENIAAILRDDAAERDNAAPTEGGAVATDTGLAPDGVRH